MLIWSTIWATKNAALQLQNSYEYIWELLRSTSQSGPDVSSASINHAGQGGSGLSTLPFNLDMNQRQCGECLSATRKLYWMFDSNLIFVHQHSDTSFWKQGFIEKSNLHFFWEWTISNIRIEYIGMLERSQWFLSRMQTQKYWANSGVQFMNKWLQNRLFLFSLKTLRKTYESSTQWINIWLTTNSLKNYHSRLVNI